MKLTEHNMKQLITDTTIILSDVAEFERVESFDFICYSRVNTKARYFHFVSDGVQVVIKGKSIYIEFDIEGNSIYFFELVPDNGFRMLSYIDCELYLKVSIVTAIAILLMKIKNTIV